MLILANQRVFFRDETRSQTRQSNNTKGSIAAYRGIIPIKDEMESPSLLNPIVG
jgi:hypothetical protein